VADGPADPAAVVGLAPRRRIPAGETISLRQLSPPADIRRGDRVDAEVHRGLARISVESAAESGGKRGEAILLRNLETGRRFRAKVTGRGKAIVP
jgi:flagella basal body P-ring formation protein FlgA